MAIKENVAYLGTEIITKLQEESKKKRLIDGLKKVKDAKHPGTIQCYDVPERREEALGKRAIRFIGIDVETDKKGDIQLIGVYKHHPSKAFRKGKGENLVEFLADMVYDLTATKTANTQLVSWGDLESITIFKLLCDYAELNEKDRRRAYAKFGKISGDFENHQWKVKPLVSCDVTIKRGKENEKIVEFGISQSYKNGSMLFYVMDKDYTEVVAPKTMFLFNMKEFFKGSLERVAMQNGLNWYQKGEEKYHVIDWNRFRTDKEFRMEVLRHNQMDARVVKELADSMYFKIVESFKTPYRTYFPRFMISSGNLTHFALAIKLTEKEYKNINFYTQMTKWADEGIEQEKILEVYLRACESFSGGHSESFGFGYLPYVCYADITSAYPYILSKLWDLENSTLLSGTGKPPKLEKSYILCRATFKNVPENQIHPIQIREVNNDNDNLMPHGQFKTTVTLQEVAFMKKYYPEVEIDYHDWVAVQTTGKQHPLGRVAKELFSFRNDLIQTNDPRQDALKLILNGVWGKTFEGNTIYEEKQDGGVIKKGVKTGKFFNPLLATFITSLNRIRLCMACKEIEANGGQIVETATDCIYWVGTPDMLKTKVNDTNMKKLGYFETKEAYEYFALGFGRREYCDENGEMIVKTLGIKMGEGESDLVTWKQATKRAVEENKTKEFVVHQRGMHDPKTALERNDLSLVGRIEFEKTQIKPFSLFPKRKESLGNEGKTLKNLLNEFIWTTNCSGLDFGLVNDLWDGTLSKLADLMKNKKVVLTSEEINEIKKENHAIRDKKLQDQLETLANLLNTTKSKLKGKGKGKHWAIKQALQKGHTKKELLDLGIIC